MENNLNRNIKESRDLQENLKNLEKTFPFILNEKDFFGNLIILIIISIIKILYNKKELKTLNMILKILISARKKKGIFK